MQLERPDTCPAGLGAIAAAANAHSIGNGVVGFLFATTGPLAILFAVAQRGGLGDVEIMSWIAMGYGFAGIVTITMSLLFRQTIAFAWTIAGGVLMGPALEHLSFAEAVGAYLVTGLLLAVLGVTGLVKRIMALVPTPLIMAMMAGMFLSLGIGLVKSFAQEFWLAIAMVGTYVVVSAMPKIARNIPPVLAALIAGAIALPFTSGLRLDREIVYAFAIPRLVTPEFSIQALVELVIPLAMTVIGVHNAQGNAVLRSQNFKPPENLMTFACGISSIVVGAFGSVPTCVVGPVTAIFHLSGAREARFLSALIFGALFILFGLAAPVIASVGLAVPPAYIAVLGGLALLGVLQNAFVIAFKGGFTLGAVATFLVTVSEMTILNVGSAFWGLVIGFGVSVLLERADFCAFRVAANGRD